MRKIITIQTNPTLWLANMVATIVLLPFFTWVRMGELFKETQTGGIRPIERKVIKIMEE